MSYDVFVPARYQATRLPGKPLAEAGGKPLIQWVYEAARRSAAERVVIATDDERVLEAARAFGAQACLTAGHHASGTDRICEAAEQLGLDGSRVIVNLQGDEPRVPPALLDRVVQALESSAGASVATAAHAIETPDELDNPNVVKVVCDRLGNALYFSRARIPYPRAPQAEGPVYRHLGIYAYRFDYLRRFAGRPASMLEKTEGLEQLRVLEYGDRIAVHATATPVAPGIDTPEDLARFRRELNNG